MRCLVLVTSSPFVLLFIFLESDGNILLLLLLLLLLLMMLLCVSSSIRMWNLHNGYCLNEIRGHEAFVYRLVSKSTHTVGVQYTVPCVSATPPFL